MATAPLLSGELSADDEDYRLSVLRSLNLLDTPPEAEFDALVAVAQHVMKCPIATISLVDDHRQWFKARCGLDAIETTRETAFCAHAILRHDVMVVPDATKDARFRSNPLVTGDPHIRFYAGVPIRVSLEQGQDPAALGTLCVIDTKPRLLTGDEREMLVNLARAAESIILGRKHTADAVAHAAKHRADALRIARQNRYLAQAERIADMGSWRFSFAGQTLEWSSQVWAIHALPEGEAPVLAQALEYFPLKDRDLLVDAITRSAWGGDGWDLEADFVAADGVRKRVRMTGEIEREDDAPVAVVGIIQDITERYELEQALLRSASQDELTRLANRAAFNAAIDRQMAEARRVGRKFALMLLDLDGFKPVNDRYGHHAGDLLLQEVARRLQLPHLDGYFAARQGGDEFALIAPIEIGEIGVFDAATRTLEELARPIDVELARVEISGTMGISWYDGELSRRDLVRRADAALYEAKNAGRGVFRVSGGG